MKKYSVHTVAVVIAMIVGATPAFAAQAQEDGPGEALPIPGAAAVFETSSADAGSDTPEAASPALTFRIPDQATAPPTPPQHSGFGALVRSTGSDFAEFPRRHSTWVILGIGGGAALLAHPADDYVTEHIVGSTTAEHVFVAGKWLGSAYVQFGGAVGLYLVGRYVVPPAPDGSRTNKISHLGFDLLRAQIVSQAFVQGIKIAVRRDRPTGECCAFPSGHAAAAFATASVLERHFKYRGAWPALVAAGYVASSRLVDNRHFLSDVVFGSALGMASGWTVVGRHGRSSFALQPVRGGMFLAFVAGSHDPSQ